MPEFMVVVHFKGEMSTKFFKSCGDALQYEREADSEVGATVELYQRSDLHKDGAYERVW